MLVKNFVNISAIHEYILVEAVVGSHKALFKNFNFDRVTAVCVQILQIHEFYDIYLSMRQHCQQQELHDCFVSVCGARAGHSPEELFCVRFGLVTEETDLEELIGMVYSTAKDVEESSKVGALVLSVVTSRICVLFILWQVKKSSYMYIMSRAVDVGAYVLCRHLVCGSSWKRWLK